MILKNICVISARKGAVLAENKAIKYEQQSDKIIADNDRPFFEPMAVFITYLINVGK